MLHAMLRAVGGSAPQSFIDSLFGAGEQGVFYIPQPVVDGTQALFQDYLGTVPVTADGDPVGLMLDQSGNGNHATQSVSTKKPIYRTDGTLHWIGADEVDDYMLVANQAFNINTFTAAMAVELSGDNNGRVFDSRGTGPRGVVGWHIKPFNSNNNPFVDTGTGDDDLSSTVISGTKVNLTQRDGVNPTILRENGVQTASDSTPVSGSILTTLDSILFANSNGQNNQLFGGNFYGGLVVESYVDVATAERIKSYFASLAGVTL